MILLDTNVVSELRKGSRADANLMLGLIGAITASFSSVRSPWLSFVAALPLSLGALPRKRFSRSASLA